MCGKIIWLTGNSGIGKTTLAKALSKKLYNYLILDGDEMRKTISVNLGFSKEDREEHNLRVARLAKVLSSQGKNVLISVIAPFESTRKKITDLLNCSWIYLKRTQLPREAYPYEEPKDIFTLNVDVLSIEEEIKLVIENLKLFNVFVFGVARSGTSMMTHIVELLGIKIFYTPGHTYQENKEGWYSEGVPYYEIEEELMKNLFQVISTPYSGCKIWLPISQYKVNIVNVVPSKVIFMERDPKSNSQAQMHFFKRATVIGSGAEFITGVLKEERRKLEQDGIDFLRVAYDQVVQSPKLEISRIKKFIGSSVSISKAVDLVNTKLNHFPKE